MNNLISIHIGSLGHWKYQRLWPYILIHSHETGLLLQETHILSSDWPLDQQQVIHSGHVSHSGLLPRNFFRGLLI